MKIAETQKNENSSRDAKFCVSAMTVLLFVLFYSCSNGPSLKAPVEEKIPHELFDNRTDNYFWMRLSDEQKSVEIPDEQTTKVLDYLRSENEYSKAVLSNTAELQKTLYDEIINIAVLCT